MLLQSIATSELTRQLRPLRPGVHPSIRADGSSPKNNGEKSATRNSLSFSTEATFSASQILGAKVESRSLVEIELSRSEVILAVLITRMKVFVDSHFAATVACGTVFFHGCNDHVTVAKVGMGTIPQVQWQSVTQDADRGLDGSIISTFSWRIILND